MPTAVSPLLQIQALTLFRKFGTSIMTIFNAIMSQKRILFSGFGFGAEEICSYVVSSVALVCPPLRGVVARAFPYTNLTALEFLAVPGQLISVY